MSMARSTPAQNPRGPPRTISESFSVMSSLPASIRPRPLRRALPEKPRQAEHGRVRFDPAIALARVAVRDVLETVTDRHRERVGQKDGYPGASLEDEGERGRGLRQFEISPGGAADDLDVRHHS